VQEPILIFTQTLTNRLDYICKFIFRDLLQVSFVFTTSINKATESENIFINYSNLVFEKGLQIIPHSIISESNIQKQIIDENLWLSMPIFFTTNGTFIPFDIFSACFYLISRYEEYQEIKKDEYGRFPHTTSLAFEREFLQLPIVDIWCHRMYEMLCKKNTNLFKSPKSFSNLHTFDIDMISAYQHKGFVKNIGGFVKNMLDKNWKACKQRWNTLIRNQKDPFDSFAELEKNLVNANTVIFFFLMASKQGLYDKNLLPTHTVMQDLIKRISKKFDIGIHPSYQSNSKSLLTLQEIESLQNISEKTIYESRQHYIKFSLPVTYQQLIKANIEIDYSMGYGSINGFRASTCTPFCWFDVSTNKTTALQIVPFCWMDANCLYEQKMKPIEALQNWQHYYTICKTYNGLFVDIWHNFIIGNGNYNKDWMNIWLKTLEIAKSKG
jgi:hypothetical protein